MPGSKRSHRCMSQVRNSRGQFAVEREEAGHAEIRRINGLLEATHNQHSEIVADLKNTAEETESICEEPQKQCASLQEALKIVETETTDVLRSLRDESEARMGVESLRNGLLEDLNRAKLEEKRLSDQIKMLQDTNKGLQEYNTSLQQYNCNLQADATKNAETIAKLQNTMVETMNGLKDHANSVKMQLDFAKEVESLRMELQHVREDRDAKSAQVDSLLADIATYKEMTGKSVIALDSAQAKTSALTETCSSQRKMIETLEIKLAAANEKSKLQEDLQLKTKRETEMQEELEGLRATLQSERQTFKEVKNELDKLKSLCDEKESALQAALMEKSRLETRITSGQGRERDTLTTVGSVNSDIEMLIKLKEELKSCQKELDASKEVTKKLMLEKNILDQKVQRLERIKNEEKSTMAKVYLDEYCKLKYQITELEQKLDVAS